MKIAKCKMQNQNVKKAPILGVWEQGELIQNAKCKIQNSKCKN
jgi:hypothetical protein